MSKKYKMVTVKVLVPQESCAVEVVLDELMRDYPGDLIRWVSKWQRAELTPEAAELVCEVEGLGKITLLDSPTPEGLYWKPRAEPHQFINHQGWPY